MHGTSLLHACWDTALCSDSVMHAGPQTTLLLKLILSVMLTLTLTLTHILL